MILLVHSCDSRLWLREHWERFFDKSGWYIQEEYILGDGVFSDRLIETLHEITDEYIWYTLDDYFIREPIDWYRYERMAIDKKMDCLRLQPNVQYDSLPYRFNWEDGLLKQRQDSAYIMSMQTSIWRRKYFLECLTPGLDPWETELSGPQLGDIYFVPQLPFWYIDAVRKGVLTDKGKKMIDGI